MKPTIEFSVISGSNEDMIVACLDSLYASLAQVDYVTSVTATCNKPGTGLSARLRARYPGITTIDNVNPRGFAANHNAVLARSKATYVWLLNDDLILGTDTVRAVTEFMERPENSRVAAVSPRLLNSDGSLQPSTYSFPSMPQTLLSHSGLRERRFVDRALALVAPVMRRGEGSSRFWAHDRTVDVDTFRGACVAMRMEAVRDVGPMVEIALVGGEEVEWHHRFRSRGWRIVFFADASVIHHGSQSVRSDSGNLYSEYLKGSLYYFRNNRPAVSYLAFCASMLAMFSAKALFAWARRDDVSRDAALQFNRVTWEGVKARLTRPREAT